MSAQPVWKFVANLGDVNTLEYGGYLIYRDETGVYPPEAVRIESPDDDTDVDDPSAVWTVHRFILEPCTFRDGILSDNRFHPDKPAWFAKPESERARRPQDTTYLANVAQFAGYEPGEMEADLCADDSDEGIIRRARAWEAIGEYHGWDNLDSYPDEWTRAELTERYPELAD